MEDHDDRLDDYDERLMMLEQANGITSYKQLLHTWVAILVYWLVVPLSLAYVHVDANIKNSYNGSYQCLLTEVEK